MKLRLTLDFSQKYLCTVGSDVWTLINVGVSLDLSTEHTYELQTAAWKTNMDWHRWGNHQKHQFYWADLPNTECSSTCIHHSTMDTFLKATFVQSSPVIKFTNWMSMWTTSWERCKYLSHMKPTSLMIHAMSTARLNHGVRCCMWTSASSTDIISDWEMLCTLLLMAKLNSCWLENQVIQAEKSLFLGPLLIAIRWHGMLGKGARIALSAFEPVSRLNAFTLQA